MDFPMIPNQPPNIIVSTRITPTLISRVIDRNLLIHYPTLKYYKKLVCLEVIRQRLEVGDLSIKILMELIRDSFLIFHHKVWVCRITGLIKLSQMSTLQWMVMERMHWQNLDLVLTTILTHTLGFTVVTTTLHLIKRGLYCFLVSWLNLRQCMIKMFSNLFQIPRNFKILILNNS